MSSSSPSTGISVAFATVTDAPLILSFIRELAEYERLSHEVVATEQELREALFGSNAPAEVLLAYLDGAAVGFAVFFNNFSTFLGRRGLYLEDLFVRPHARGRGVGRALLAAVANIAVARGCGRVEWSVLDWNSKAKDFYQGLGARPLDEWTIFRLHDESLKRLALEARALHGQRRE
jgi:GNAT superfamily N-acetyltransferase